MLEMEIEQKYKKSLKLLNDDKNLDDNLLKILLENCCKTLSKRNGVHDIPDMLPSSSVEIRELYSSLLYLYSQSVRHSISKEDFSVFLSSECNVPKEKILILSNYYEVWKKDIRIQLMNIGNHSPHVTDVRWKIDYNVKFSASNRSEGPIFRVSLKTEKYDIEINKRRVTYLDFTCTNQELQDLVYKLKDAVRHCQKIASEH